MHWIQSMSGGMHNWNRLHDIDNSPVRFLPNQSTNNRVEAGAQRYSGLGLLEVWRIWSPVHSDRFDISLNSPAIYIPMHEIVVLL